MAFFFPQRAHEYEGDAGEVDLIYRGETLTIIGIIIVIIDSAISNAIFIIIQ
jgi:hypothetical protein